MESKSFLIVVLFAFFIIAHTMFHFVRFSFFSLGSGVGPSGLSLTSFSVVSLKSPSSVSPRFRIQAFPITHVAEKLFCDRGKSDPVLDLYALVNCPKYALTKIVFPLKDKARVILGAYSIFRSLLQ